MQLGIDLMVETLKQWSLWQILLQSQLLSALPLATLFWVLSVLLTYGGKVLNFLVYSLSQEVILWVKSPDQPPGISHTQIKCVLLWPPWVWFHLSKTRCCFWSVLWAFAWRKVLGTAGVMCAVTSPAALGGTHQQWLMFVICPAHVWVWRGRSPPVAEWWNETLPQRAWRYLGPSQPCSCSEGMDAAPPASLCTVCLKIIWVLLIVSQLQHGSPQSCWKEKSCWHYGWYLFRAAHCAWQRLPGGGLWWVQNYLCRWI